MNLSKILNSYYGGFLLVGRTVYAVCIEQTAYVFPISLMAFDFFNGSIVYVLPLKKLSDGIDVY